MLPKATALVEREQQLATLTELVHGPGGATALIVGEAGAGKSALLGEVLRDVPAGLCVWRGQCEPLAVPAPFSALFEMLPSVPAELADEIRTSDDVIGVYSSILALMRRRPIVLVLDDLQWADAATAGLARYLARRIEGTSSTMICALRDEELDGDREVVDVLADLVRVSTRIDLPPLSEAGVEGLVAAMAPDRICEAAAIHRVTGGNPLFVVEALRTSIGDLPVSVGELVIAQVRRLPIATQNLVESIALCPDGLTLDAALALSADAGDHIDTACARRVLSVARERVTCRHELLRNAIDASIPPVRRRQNHRRLVAVLEPTAIHRRDVAHLAYHASAAGLAVPAVHYSLAAAATAVSAGAHREAAELLCQALDFRDVLSPDALDRTLSSAFVELLLAGRLDAARHILAERAALATTEEAQMEIRLQELELTVKRDRCNDSIPLARSVLDRSPATRARLLAGRLLAGAAWFEGRHGDAVTILEHVLSELPAVATADRSEVVRTRGLLGSILQSRGDSMGSALLAEALADALELGADEHAAFAYNNLLAHAVWQCDLPLARERFAAGLQFTMSRQLDNWTRSLHSSAAVVDLFAGDWVAARSHGDDGVDPEPIGSDGVDHELLYVDATICVRLGEPAEVKLAAALAPVDAEGASYMAAVAAAELAMEAVWSGLHDRREALARRDALLAAPALVADSWARARIGFWSQRCFGEFGVDDAPGPVGSELAGDLVAAAAGWERLDMPFHAALVRADLPEPPVAEVLDVLGTLGAERTADTVRRRWSARGVAVPSKDAHPSGLTARQLEVLALVAAGCTNAEIASRLFISEKTAGHHVSAILRRLAVPTRWAAASIATRSGWL